MPVPISSRAAKYLGPSPYYTALQPNDTEWSSRVNLAQDEQLIGVYQNVPGQVFDSIAISNRGIHVIGAAESRFIAYADMREIRSASHDKMLMSQNVDARHLLITLNSGAEVDLHIAGSRGPGQGIDLASFHSFLNGACRTTDIENRQLREQGVVSQPANEKKATT